MREFLIKENDANQRLDRFLGKAVPLLPQSLAQKFIRTKRIKINGKRTERNYRLSVGDKVQLYIGDEYFGPVSPKYAHLAAVDSELNIVYEDDNILIIDKEPGIVCQPDKSDDRESLVTRVQAYLYKTKKWIPEEETTFVPALCNRLDRNTGGIVLAAKNAQALKALNEKIRLGQVRKYYLCIVCGVPEPSESVLDCYILKDRHKNRVTVLHEKSDGAKRAITSYKTLETRGGGNGGGGISLVECEIMTGRSHQIRAQMASIGCPLLGDAKYGEGGVKGNERWQALYSYKVAFSFSGESGMLDYLSGRTFAVKSVDFAEKYFMYNIII